MSKFLTAGALLTSLLISTVQAQEPVLKIETKEDLVFKKVDSQELKLDLAMPAEGDGPFPAIVVIHGGGWRGGDKASNRSTLAEMAQLGFVAISPQYRFWPDSIFPAQVHDVKAAVRWLRSNAEEYNVDPERFGAVGFSAGGHLALMLGVTDEDDGLEGEVPDDAPSSKVQAVVNYFGPTDLAADDIPDASAPLLAGFIGGDPKEKPEATKQGSPVTFITEDDPPILTFQGTKDPLVPHTQAFKLTDAMTEAGVPGRVELLIGAGHGWSGEELERTKRLTLEFFEMHLKP